MTAISTTHYKVILGAPHPDFSTITTTSEELLRRLALGIDNTQPGTYYCIAFTHCLDKINYLADYIVQSEKMMWDMEYLTIKAQKLTHDKANEFALKILTKEISNLKKLKKSLDQTIHEHNQGYYQRPSCQTTYLRLYKKDKPNHHYAYTGSASADAIVNLKGIRPDEVSLENRHAISHTHDKQIPSNPNALLQMLACVRQDILYYKKIYKQTPATNETEFFLQVLGREIAEDKTLKDQIKQELKMAAS